MERAFGESPPVYTRQHIFVPLQMTSTAWRLSEVERDKHTTNFVSQNGMAIPIPGHAEMTRFQFSDANRPENFPAEEGNSGLFSRTKFNGTRVGHGGNDPGLSAEMLADLTGEIGIVLFVNTSVSGPD